VRVGINRITQDTMEVWEEQEKGGEGMGTGQGRSNTNPPYG
jgi:hypothetical protein